LVPGQLLAQSAVDERVEKLEETVRALERRIASLEDQLGQRSSSAPVAPNKANWRKLERGMSAKDVEQLLGSPWKVDANPYRTLWFYGDGIVELGSRGRVEGWSEH
jgi:hypothetical protein